ncbi:MAG: hypothetical protein ABI461_21310 [Polyangiaceae bacterium]
MRLAFVAALLFAVPVACGGTKNSPVAGASPAGNADADAGGLLTDTAPSATSASSGSDAGATATSTMPAVVDASAASAPEAHPFAKDAAAAESMIDDAIESRHSGIEKCAAEERQRLKDPHAKVSVLIGIDQEGSVLGIKTPKGEKKDEKLLVCVRAALKDAPFPKSHSGVITIKKTYEEALKGQL